MLEIMYHLSQIFYHYKVQAKSTATVILWLHKYEHSKTAYKNDSNNNGKNVTGHFSRKQWVKFDLQHIFLHL